MGKNTGRKNSSGLAGTVMWFWIAVIVGTLLFKFTGIVDVETPLGMLIAFGIITGGFVLVQFLLNLRGKAS